MWGEGIAYIFGRDTHDPLDLLHHSMIHPVVTQGPPAHPALGLLQFAAATWFYFCFELSGAGPRGGAGAHLAILWVARLRISGASLLRHVVGLWLPRGGFCLLECLSCCSRAVRFRGWDASSAGAIAGEVLSGGTAHNAAAALAAYFSECTCWPFRSCKI